MAKVDQGRIPDAMLEPRSIKYEGLNESTPFDQRHPTGNCPKSDGPRFDENGTRLPAEYPFTMTIPGSNGQDKTITVIRRDR